MLFSAPSFTLTPSSSFIPIVTLSSPKQSRVICLLSRKHKIPRGTQMSLCLRRAQFSLTNCYLKCSSNASYLWLHTNSILASVSRSLWHHWYTKLRQAIAYAACANRQSFHNPVVVTYVLHALLSTPLLHGVYWWIIKGLSLHYSLRSHP